MSWKRIIDTFQLMSGQGAHVEMLNTKQNFLFGKMSVENVLESPFHFIECTDMKI